MGVLWIAIKALLGWYFRGNIGGSFEWHLRDNWGYAKQVVMLDPMMIAYALLAFGGFHIWSSLVIGGCSRELKAIYWSAIALVLVMACTGLMMELRIFHEAVVGFTLPVVVWVVTKYRPTYLKQSPYPFR